MSTVHYTGLIWIVDNTDLQGKFFNQHKLKWQIAHIGVALDPCPNGLLCRILSAVGLLSDIFKRVQSLRSGDRDGKGDNYTMSSMVPSSFITTQMRAGDLITGFPAVSLSTRSFPSLNTTQITHSVLCCIRMESGLFSCAWAYPGS